MRDEERPELNRHLTPDEIELCALEAAGPRRPERLRAHLRSCVECRDEVAALAELDRRLATLPALAASPAFADRVLARVQLPVPWYREALAALRRRWLVVAVGLSGAVATVGGMGWWRFGQQGLTPGALVTFVYEGLRSLLLQGVISVGRALYEVGLVDLVGDVAARVTLPEAATAMALVSLLGMAALLTMRKVVEAAGAPRVARG
jgi:hypothetical protein